MLGVCELWGGGGCGEEGEELTGRGFGGGFAI